MIHIMLHMSVMNREEGDGVGLGVQSHPIYDPVFAKMMQSGGNSRRPKMSVKEKFWGTTAAGQNCKGI